jgi:AcrR family transcriptional regulator
MYTARRKTTTRRSSPTRARVIDAVRELLAEGAFQESTVEDVARRAGIARATLYLHFPSRLSLVDAICEAFDANPALIALRAIDELDEFLEQVVRFWASEEKVLVQLYGAAAVDPAAAALVERQRRDRYGELRRILRTSGSNDRKVLAELAVLTSFETYRELRRHAGLPLRDVERTLVSGVRRLVG